MSTSEEERKLSSQYWRLNHLYWVKNEKGEKVRFRLNRVQFTLLKTMWYLNIVLKSRQHGITTIIAIFFLDCCLFNSCIEAGIIAHTRSDVIKIFENKVRFAYDNLEDEFKQAIKPSKTDAKNELHFENDSCIRVGTEMRSGTLQYLHISEFGKICAKYPAKAGEIVTGALNTVHVGQVIFIESTAEGRAGFFYQYCQDALKLEREKKRLTKVDWKFHFFPWWIDPKNVLSDEDAKTVPVPSKIGEYFRSVEQVCGATLSHAQKAWYIKKKEKLGDKIKAEYPFTPEEAFEKQIEGAYWAAEMTKVRSDERICRVPYNPSLLVETWWDLGIDDYMAIWFTQNVGKEIFVIDYYAWNGEGLAYYRDRLEERKYRYGIHHAPHDIEVRVMDEHARTRKEIALGLGIKFVTVPRVQNKADAIEAVRTILPVCWFDEAKCEDGIISLENYRKKWNEAMQQYGSEPVKDEYSHGADAFQTLAMGHSFDTLSGVGALTHQGARQQFKIARM